MADAASPKWSTPLALTVLAWGFNFPAIAVLYHQMSAQALALIRLLIMAAVVVPWAWARGQSVRVEAPDLWRIRGLGFLSLGVYMVLFLEGMRHTNPAEASIIISTSPLWVSLIRAGLRQAPLSLLSVVGAVVAIFGVGLIVLEGHDGSSSTWLGYGLIFSAAVLWAVCVVISKPLTETLGPLRTLAGGIPAALIVLIPYGFSAVLETDFAALKPVSWGMLAHISILAGGLGFLGFYSGVKKIGPQTAMLYQFFVPPVAAASTWLVLGRPLGILQGVGLAIVLLGVWLSTRPQARLRA